MSVGDIFRSCSESYCRENNLPFVHLKVIENIKACRTASMGGHMHKCSSCGHEHPVYNPCGNRHCPGCQSLAKARWLQKRQAELLPVNYFHMVFTLPHKLNPFIRYNKRLAYDLLFRAVSEVLLEFGSSVIEVRIKGKKPHVPVRLLGIVMASRHALSDPSRFICGTD